MKNVTLYHITKKLKNGGIVGFLSPKMVRWLPRNTSHRIGKFTEQQCNDFIKKRDADNEYYYLKTLI